MGEWTVHYGLSPIEKGKLRILQNEYLGPHFLLLRLFQIRNIWGKQFGQFHFHSLFGTNWFWRTMKGLILLYFLRTSWMYLLKVTANISEHIFRWKWWRKYLSDICPMKGASDKNVIFYSFFWLKLIGQHTKFQICQTPPSCFLQITSQIFDIYDKNQNQ